MANDLDITATENTVKNILSGNYRFQVPEYQREYAWTEEQWDDLWYDLKEVINTGGTHFLGSVVLVNKQTTLDELPVVEIVDGQQRLVTISVLLCVIRQRMKSSDKWGDGETPAKRIDSEYLWERDEDMEKYPNIRLSTFDNDEYQELLRGNLPSNENSQLVAAAEYFNDKIAQMEIDEVNELRKRLVNSMTLVKIECNNESSAFKLFETLNDRGLELSAVDLMKNYLFKVATESTEIDYEYVKSDWEKIINEIKPELSKPGRFFRHYMMGTDTPQIDDPVSSYTLYNRFCEIIDTIKSNPDSDTTVEDYISDMRRKAPLYVDIVLSDTDEFAGNANRKINQKLKNLDTLGSTQERTLIFRLFTELDNPNDLIRSLDALESFVFRWRVAGGTTGTEIDEIHTELTSKIFDFHDPVNELAQKLKSKAHDDPEVRLAIKTSDLPRNARTRYILSKIENEYYTTGSKVTEIETVEIEHVAPRKSYRAKKYSTWPQYLGVSEESFEENCNKIGNLTLLNERMNARAQDNPFRQKKREYEGSEFEMTKEICDYEDWSIENIEKRTEKLAEIAPKIWDFDK
ncbi:DUF262 domain-containing protein [Halorubrum sp. GN11GM_10-3_MGM]|uniref:DUF262 domain-containing protein n=1 Tax=Halorubrum sp. GN11GM_10-3_MGM TaxID=2518111 RepID=UPI0010F6B209|nr:DUF262 domain-containing protein [Halorubrum sp. GN11GM_10-3_MGM]TKX72170.1 DUF262 domain-containing protein [Halorubrum sp. GN11GM_10-3_MGM]